MIKSFRVVGSIAWLVLKALYLHFTLLPCFTSDKIYPVPKDKQSSPCNWFEAVWRTEHILMGWNYICPSEADILVQFPLQDIFFAIFEAILETIQSSLSTTICFKTLWFATEPKPRCKYIHKFTDHVITRLMFIVKALNFSAINSRIRIPYLWNTICV